MSLRLCGWTSQETLAKSKCVFELSGVSSGQPPGGLSCRALPCLVSLSVIHELFARHDYLYLLGLAARAVQTGLCTSALWSQLTDLEATLSGKSLNNDCVNRSMLRICHGRIGSTWDVSCYCSCAYSLQAEHWLKWSLTSLLMLGQ